MAAKVDPTYVSDYHFGSIARVRRFLVHFGKYELTTMAEFQILLGIILGRSSILKLRLPDTDPIRDS